MVAISMIVFWLAVVVAVPILLTRRKKRALFTYHYHSTGSSKECTLCRQVYDLSYDETKFYIPEWVQRGETKNINCGCHKEGAR